MGYQRKQYRKKGGHQKLDFEAVKRFVEHANRNLPEKASRPNEFRDRTKNHT